MTAELAPLALCSGGANISAEVLQLNHADLGLLTLPEQIRNHSGLCPPICSFFCSCLVSALLFLCFGFLKCALWELRPALRQTPVKGCVQPQRPAGLLAQLQPASHNHCFPLCWDSPHLQQELAGDAHRGTRTFLLPGLHHLQSHGVSVPVGQLGGVGGGGSLPGTLCPRFESILVCYNPDGCSVNNWMYLLLKSRSFKARRSCRNEGKEEKAKLMFSSYTVSRFVLQFQLIFIINTIKLFSPAYVTATFPFSVW